MHYISTNNQIRATLSLFPAQNQVVCHLWQQSRTHNSKHSCSTVHSASVILATDWTQDIHQCASDGTPSLVPQLLLVHFAESHDWSAGDHVHWLVSRCHFPMTAGNPYRPSDSIRGGTIPQLSSLLVPHCLCKPVPCSHHIFSPLLTTELSCGHSTSPAVPPGGRRVS
jgi:hypothetical protein